MKSLAPCLFALVLTVAAHPARGGKVPPPSLPARFREFHVGANGMPPGWKFVAPSPALKPRADVDPKGGFRGGGSLHNVCGEEDAYGFWQTDVSGVSAGQSYQFSALYRARSVPFEARSVVARLVWLGVDGGMVRPPDYARTGGREGAWTRLEWHGRAPTEAKAVRVELAFGWAAGGAVWWDDIHLREAADVKPRPVRVLTVAHRPSGMKSSAEAVQSFCRLVLSASDEKPDVICLPEGVTVIGTGRPYRDVAEPLPGPATDALGALARSLNAYVVAGVYEREGNRLYNTAVLMGRDGKLAGKYRKTHLPREEVEAGITPGREYPVFRTDFGTVGLMICWDVQFPEPARAMALKGAELLLLPIWGGSEVLARARAIENHAYLVSSSYDMRTFVVAPNGEVLAEATIANPIALAEIDLNRALIQPWLGDMKERTWRERRSDLPVEPQAPGR